MEGLPNWRRRVMMLRGEQAAIASCSGVSLLGLMFIWLMSAPKFRSSKKTLDASRTKFDYQSDRIQMPVEDGNS